ncbi:hypothetical protein [Actinokineospora sp. NPDC004072]
MRIKGITYDTGFLNGTATTRPTFDPQDVARDLRAIRHDLRCAAVRLTGGDLDRLDLAARLAAEVGLEVWFSPFTCEVPADDLLAMLADGAERMARVDGRVVFLTGSELSLFTPGFIPGETVHDRLPNLAGDRAGLPERINDFLAEAVRVVRARFDGPVSYASLPFEGVDWTPFDFVATDAAYRDATNAATFAEQIRAAVAAAGKPLAITEFGCTTHRGAAALGGRGDSLIRWSADGAPAGLTHEVIRDETEQAQYLRELLTTFTDAGVDAAFVNTFARYDLPDALDPASYGIVTTHPDGTWHPKEAFAAVADHP